MLNSFSKLIFTEVLNFSEFFLSLIIELAITGNKSNHIEKPMHCINQFHIQLEIII
jgi:hypothetical protein